MAKLDVVPMKIRKQVNGTWEFGCRVDTQAKCIIRSPSIVMQQLILTIQKAEDISICMFRLNLKYMLNL